MKKYYFIAGLPRSGSTLLSSILNQNKDILTTPNSIVPDIFHNLNYIKYSNGNINFPMNSSIQNVCKKIFENYYEEWNAKYIIDRSTGWGFENNFFYLKEYCPNEIKIICPVRNILEILCSFVELDKRNHYYSNLISSRKKIEFSYKTKVEEICDFIMENNSMMDRSLCSLKNLLKEENKTFIHLIDYNNLVENPTQEIKNIYDFLEIKYFNHDFDNIDQYNISGSYYNDEAISIKYLHEIRSKIEKIPRNVSDILTENVVKKYSHINFWDLNK